MNPGEARCLPSSLFFGLLYATKADTELTGAWDSVYSIKMNIFLVIMDRGVYISKIISNVYNIVRMLHVQTRRWWPCVYSVSFQFVLCFLQYCIMTSAPH